MKEPFTCTCKTGKMTVLYLGPPSPLVEYLQKDHIVVTAEHPVSTTMLKIRMVDFVVSYNYRHIIQPDVLEILANRVINLHISYLPWNRGADPNFWSWLDNTPKGVTIHYIDKGLDTGDIIAQREVKLTEGTLKTTYETLHGEIQKLFKEYWPIIKNGTCSKIPQSERGDHTIAVATRNIGGSFYPKVMTQISSMFNVCEQWMSRSYQYLIKSVYYRISSPKFILNTEDI